MVDLVAVLRDAGVTNIALRPAGLSDVTKDAILKIVHFNLPKPSESL